MSVAASFIFQLKSNRPAMERHCQEHVMRAIGYADQYRAAIIAVDH